MTELPYVRQPVDFSESIRYAYGPDSFPQDGVPRGSITEHEWSASEIYPDTTRRYFLQAATRDLNWNAPERNWLSANLRVAAALAERDYDFRFVLGDGGHTSNHPGVILPDALRWLWRDNA